MIFKLCNNGLSVVGTREDGATVSYSIEAKEYKQWVLNGGIPLPEDVYVAPAPTVVTKLQLMEAMLETGVTATSNMWLDFKAIKAMNELLSDYWNSALDVNRNHPMTLGMKPLMNKTDTDLDALFLLASTK